MNTTLDELMRLRKVGIVGDFVATDFCEWMDDDAAYITAACNAIPRLVEVIRMAEEASKNLIDFHRGPWEDKRPDVFEIRMRRLEDALAAIRALDQQDGAL